ncbi:unnamed protein product [Allacma fusca]|uniref:Uncharacterized protein n=1 Tax=Allacma fusca TaxID=39272 RepID=A0A8J2K7L2_9HEXA|nr:unnamed protein product [Allacma fusca]
MLTIKLILLCLVPVLTKGSAVDQWQPLSYYFNRVPKLTPIFYGSPSSLNPTFLKASGSGPDCPKGKSHKDVTVQSGTNSFGTVSSAQGNDFNNHNSISVPVPGFTHYKSSNSYPNSKTYVNQGQNHRTSNNNMDQVIFNEPVNVQPKSENQAAATSYNANSNQNDDYSQDQNSQSDVFTQNNINITASTLYQIPGMEHLRNCVPIPGTDGACVILQDDTNSDHHSETSTAKSVPPSKELIYVPPKTPIPRVNFRANEGNQNQNGNNYYDTPFNLRDRFVNINTNQNTRVRPVFSLRNNNNQVSGQTGSPGGVSSQILPSPQALHANANGNANAVGFDKHSEGSEKVPGKKTHPPMDSLPVSPEFYMQFLKLWSLYHKRYGCSFRPLAPNRKRSVKGKNKKNKTKKTVNPELSTDTRKWLTLIPQRYYR